MLDTGRISIIAHDNVPQFEGAELPTVVGLEVLAKGIVGLKSRGVGKRWVKRDDMRMGLEVGG